MAILHKTTQTALSQHTQHRNIIPPLAKHASTPTTAHDIRARRACLSACVRAEQDGISARLQGRDAAQCRCGWTCGCGVECRMPGVGCHLARIYVLFPFASRLAFVHGRSLPHAPRPTHRLVLSRTLPLPPCLLRARSSFTLLPTTSCLAYIHHSCKRLHHFGSYAYIIHAYVCIWLRVHLP